MDITLTRKPSETKSATYSVTNLNAWLENVRTCKYGFYGELYRQDYPYLLSPKLWRSFGQLYNVMVAAKYVKNANGEPVFRSYNGILPLKVEGLSEKSVIERVKREAMLLPQTLAAMTGVEGRSVIILTRAMLPKMQLPESQAEAELFHIKAYRTAVQCYAPTLSRPITIEKPSLDMSFLAPFDENLLRNDQAVPFIIEQPSQLEVDRLVDARTPSNLVRENRPDWGGVSCHQVFNACLSQAYMSMTDEDKRDPLCVVVRIAHECADAGLPEEIATREILYHYYKVDAQDVRSTIRSVYQTVEVAPVLNPNMPKKQLATIRLQEFLKRRYELRRNVVTNVLEYRVRDGFDFCFHELTKYDRNTIKHEAALEGIEAFDGEINGYIESNYTPRYNPIDEYIDYLPKWDGKDRIDQLAAMVPTDNANWTRLFRRWFLCMVAHWMDIDAEHGNNTAPILIGKQGFRKSTFCRILLPPELRTFFTDSLDFRTKQDAERYLTRFLLINIDEFDQLSEQQFAFVKHLFQKPVVSMRRMYSESIVQQRRYASFIGTSNRQDVLRDPTGNRRYICVEVTAPIRTDVAVEYAQLYAEAVELIRQGERYWLDDDDEALLRISNGVFEAMTPLELLLQDIFRPAKENAEGAELLSMPQMLEVLSQHKVFNRKSMNNLVHLGRALTKLGFRSKRKSTGTYYWVKRV